MRLTGYLARRAPVLKKLLTAPDVDGKPPNRAAAIAPVVFELDCCSSVTGRIVVAEPAYSGPRFPIGRRDLQELVRAVSARPRAFESRGAIGYRLTSTGRRQPMHATSAIAYRKRSHYFMR